MIRIAFLLLGRGRWTGGEVYLKNTLTVLRRHLHDDVQSVVLLTPAQNEKHGADLAGLADEVLVDERFEHWGRGRSALRALAFGADSWARPFLAAHRIDVLFEHTSYFGWRPGAGILVWFPDFQHRLLPNTFSRYEFWHRDVGLRLQILTRNILMLSSQSARSDFVSQYPGSRIDIRVVRFAAEIDPGRYLSGGEELRRKYDLPERFFYLPNQFWRHKNYEVVVDALEILARRGGDVPPVILSGRIDGDAAFGGYHAEIMARIAARGVSSMIRHVGMVPYEDVLRLNGACHALINPSLFEGWSTPIEEAKALGTRMVLSDLAVHREQVPQGHFFDPRDPEDCARALSAAAAAPPLDRRDPDVLRAAQQQRIAAHAAALREAILAAARQNTLR
jgi:glycosyltransferase involved in cell wall biosynthesis